MAENQEAKTVKKETNYVLPEPNLKGGDFARTVHSALIPHGTPFEALLNPEYWSLQCTKVRQFDKIEVTEESGAYYGELLVMQRGINRLNVEKLCYVEFEPIEAQEANERMQIIWKGPQKKFCLIDTQDGKVVQEGMYPKSQAYKQLEDYIAVQAR